MRYLGIFGLEFENIIVILEITAPEFALLQSLVQKINVLIFRTKNARFACFGARI